MIEHDVDPILMEQAAAARTQAEEEFEAGRLGHIKVSERLFRQTKKLHERDFPDVHFDEEFMREEMLIQERSSQIMLGQPLPGEQPIITPMQSTEYQSVPLPQRPQATRAVPHSTSGVHAQRQTNAPVPYGWGSVIAMWIAAGIGFMAFFPLGIALGVVALVMGSKLKMH